MSIDPEKLRKIRDILRGEETAEGEAKPSFWVELKAQARVSAGVLVTAETEEEAKESALWLAKSGNVEWEYDGADDKTIEVEVVRQLK